LPKPVFTAIEAANATYEAMQLASRRTRPVLAVCITLNAGFPANFGGRQLLGFAQKYFFFKRSARHLQESFVRASEKARQKKTT